jgi:ribosomal protein L39E
LCHFDRVGGMPNNIGKMNHPTMWDQIFGPQRLEEIIPSIHAGSLKNSEVSRRSSQKSTKHLNPNDDLPNLRSHKYEGRELARLLRQNTKVPFFDKISAATENSVWVSRRPWTKLLARKDYLDEEFHEVLLQGPWPCILL